MAKLLYQGHASLRCITRQGTVIYIDPYAGDGYEVPADLILVSHEHGDHNQVNLVTLKPGGRILRARDLIQEGQYRTLNHQDIRIQAVPAYNQNHKKEECVGFLLWLDGIALYIAGDTSKTDDMAKLAEQKLDYAFLPADGIYNMGVEEAQDCAQTIKARHTVPIHMKPGALFDEETARRFTAEGRLILRPGDEIELIN